MSRYFNLKSLTLLVTVLSVLVPVWIWRADLSSRSLQVRLVSQVALEPDISGSIEGLQISISGVPLKAPYLSVIELSNNGDKPIPSADFEAPLEILVTDGALVWRAEVTETRPKDIEVDLSLDPVVIEIKPLLINPNDAITLSVLTSGRKPVFTTRARIAGVSIVPIEDNPGKPPTIQKAAFLLFAALLLFIASSITNDSFISNEPVLLRKRAAILVSAATGVTGAAAFMAFLDTVGVTDAWLTIIGFVAIIFSAIVVSVYWNWNTKKADHKEDGK